MHLNKRILIFCFSPNEWLMAQLNVFSFLLLAFPFTWSCLQLIVCNHNLIKSNVLSDFLQTRSKVFWLRFCFSRQAINKWWPDRKQKVAKFKLTLTSDSKCEWHKTCLAIFLARLMNWIWGSLIESRLGPWFQIHISHFRRLMKCQFFCSPILLMQCKSSQNQRPRWFINSL